MTTIDLNCDMGELDELADMEERLVRFVTSGNIACGGHAGDRESMLRTIRLCKSAGVAVGAHPSYPDRQNFGRSAMAIPLSDLRASLEAQLREFAHAAESCGVGVRHIKPHGALYHAMADQQVARMFFEISRSVFPNAALVALAGASTLNWWRQWGSSASPTVVLGEAFADRVYNADGSLRSRSLTGSVITDPSVAAAQAVEIAARGRVRAVDGSWVAVFAQTLCIHGDSPHADHTAHAIRDALEAASLRVGVPL